MWKKIHKDSPLKKIHAKIHAKIHPFICYTFLHISDVAPAWLDPTVHQLCDKPTRLQAAQCCQPSTCSFIAFHLNASGPLRLLVVCQVAGRKPVTNLRPSLHPQVVPIPMSIAPSSSQNAGMTLSVNAKCESSCPTEAICLAEMDGSIIGDKNLESDLRMKCSQH